MALGMGWLGTAELIGSTTAQAPTVHAAAARVTVPAKVAAPVVHAVPAAPVSAPAPARSAVTTCGNYDLGAPVGMTYLCPASGPITLASDGCDGGPTFAREEVSAVARLLVVRVTMVCGPTSYTADGR